MGGKCSLCSNDRQNGADLEYTLVRELAHEASRAAAHQVTQVHLMHYTKLGKPRGAAFALHVCDLNQKQ